MDRWTKGYAEMTKDELAEAVWSRILTERKRYFADGKYAARMWQLEHGLRIAP